MKMRAWSLQVLKKKTPKPTRTHIYGDISPLPLPVLPERRSPGTRPVACQEGRRGSVVPDSRGENRLHSFVFPFPTSLAKTRSGFPKHGGYLPVGSGKLEIIEFTGLVQAPSHTQKGKPSDEGTLELVRLQPLFSGFLVCSSLFSSLPQMQSSAERDLVRVCVSPQLCLSSWLPSGHGISAEQKSDTAPKTPP